jgi:serine/threonine protein kinase
VARLFDAGNMPDGRPYFVMELIEGRSLTDYCDGHRLGIRDRLSLFLQVCAGVEHAHRRGILHRDLKPSNLLVSHSDGGPSVKVIDFGIARALGAELPFGTLATEAGRLMGTPEYMSPEQVDGDPRDVDTRADVYALGVVLYELLCGRLPFDSRRLRSSHLSELRRIVCEVEPPPPGRSWSGDDAGLVSAAANRGAAPAALAREVDEEIGWVAMRAIRKTPGERYRGVAELADDIRNYLAGGPLIAGPDSAAYRIRKFVTRHRGAVGSAAAIVVLLIVAVVGTSVGMVRAGRERDRSDLRLADMLLDRGQRDLEQSQFVNAWDAFAQAREIHERLGRPPVAGGAGALRRARQG